MLSDLSANSPVISIQHLYKAYEGQEAVKGLSFDVAGGHILGLIGPNGAGKTTTMRALSALIPATSGRLTVGGFDVQQQPVEVKRRLAYVPDDPQLFPHLTVAEHLAFTAAAYGVKDPEELANELLTSFALDDKRHVVAKDLSRGMKQKLAISCAYLFEPQALLLDEPLTGLDPLGIRNLKESIRSRAAAGAAVIVSSHLLAMVEDLCTHILLLESGEQQFFGTVDELKMQFGGETSDDASSLEQIFL